MSKTNPRKAMAALLPLAVECPCGAVVRPMTLGMWAALERISSPLVTGKEPKDTLELVPSLYLLTHDPREVLRGTFFADAVAWANTLPISAVEEITRACYRQMGAMYDVLPEVKKRPAAKRRVDRVRRLMGGEGLRLELARDHVGNPSLSHRTPPAPGRTSGREDFPAQRDRED